MLWDKFKGYNLINTSQLHDCPLFNLHVILNREKYCRLASRTTMTRVFSPLFRKIRKMDKQKETFQPKVITDCSLQLVLTNTSTQVTSDMKMQELARNQNRFSLIPVSNLINIELLRTSCLTLYCDGAKSPGTANRNTFLPQTQFIHLLFNLLFFLLFCWLWKPARIVHSCAVV